MDNSTDSDSSSDSLILKFALEDNDDEITKRIRKSATNVIKRVRTDHYWEEIYPYLDPRTYNHYYRKQRTSIIHLRDIIYNYQQNMYQDIKLLEKVICMTVEYLAFRATLISIGNKYNFSEGIAHMHTTNMFNIFSSQFHSDMVK